MMPRDVMVDLETLGTEPGAVIISSGAVVFDRQRGVLLDELYRGIDPRDAVSHGLHMDVGTVMWWMQQSDAARAALTRGQRFPLVEALLDFSMLLTTADKYGGPDWPRDDGVRVRGNGAAFDNVLLRAAYEAIGRTPPWGFWNDRCYRTFRNEYPDVPRVEPDTAHHALADARAQAQHVLNIDAANRG